jgi:tRNA-specific 2-thiouridylase
VCFITSTGGRETFLGSRIPFHPARVVDDTGADVGRVTAVELVTVGQRRALGLPGGGPKRFVLAVDPMIDGDGLATVVVGAEEALLDPTVGVERVSWVDEPVDGRVLVQSSAHGAPRAATIEHGHDGVVRVTWAEPQRRVAVGQSVVFYDLDDRRVHGGGIAA